MVIVVSEGSSKVRRVLVDGYVAGGDPIKYYSFLSRGTDNNDRWFSKLPAHSTDYSDTEPVIYTNPQSSIEHLIVYSPPNRLDLCSRVLHCTNDAEAFALLSQQFSNPSYICNFFIAKSNVEMTQIWSNLREFSKKCVFRNKQEYEYKNSGQFQDACISLLSQLDRTSLPALEILNRFEDYSLAIMQRLPARESNEIENRAVFVERQVL